MSGLYSGERFIIGSGTPVIGGIFRGDITTYVDFVENPEPYERAYDMVRLSDHGLGSPYAVKEAVGEVVREVIPFSKTNMASILTAEAQARSIERMGLDDEVNQSRFMFAGGAICHQQALLAATTLELLNHRRGLPGQWSIETAGSLSDPLRSIDVAYQQGDGRVLIMGSRTDRRRLAR